MPCESNDKLRILEQLRTLDMTELSSNISDDDEDEEDGGNQSVFGDDPDHFHEGYADSSWIEKLRGPNLFDSQDNDYVFDSCDSISNCSSDTELFFAAPNFSPCKADDVLINGNFDADMTSPDTAPVDKALSDTVLPDIELPEVVTHHQKWKGFKDVCDNFDVNLKPSFQRFNNKTNSLHYLQHYALLDRVGLSESSEFQPSNDLDLKKILINKDDITQLENDAMILVER